MEPGVSLAPRVKLAPKRRVLILWALLTAVVVLIAYVLALTLAVVCALGSLAALSVFSFPSILVGLGLGVCAFMILWSLVPRPDRFVPPGPEMTASGQPRLFTEIASVAAEFEEPVPESVYLILEPNAAVAERGGMLGLGSRRVMFIGLPVLSTLSITEFRAVLAHEFAHYYGGDTGMGPWIQKAREALGKSLQRLTSNSGVLSILSRWAVVAILRLIIIWIFALYWKIFLKLTLIVSRRAEYRADELACAVAGPKQFLHGLENVHRAILAWPGFWQTEATPSFQAGFRPVLSDGFARFLVAPNVVAGVDRKFAELAAQKPNPLETHPTLQQRATRIRSYQFPEPPADSASALTLLDGASRLEAEALQMRFPDLKVPQLKPVTWDLVGLIAYVPQWIAYVTAYRGLLADYYASDIPAAVANLGQLGAKIRDPKGMLLTREQRAERAAALLWMSFTLALLTNGWQLRTSPGDSCVVRGDRKLVPAEMVTQLRQGKMTAAQFHSLLEELGIGALSLAPSNENSEGALRALHGTV